jgi:glycosyltransferase involved in cell wall biosynthesis
MMTSSIKKYIHAANIHCGGGETLLDALILAASNDQDVLVLVDARFAAARALPPSVQFRAVQPNLYHRFMAECWLVANVGKADQVLCFGNLPPLWKLKGRVTLFLQNRNLLDRLDWKNFTVKTRLKVTAERMWLSCRLRNVDAFVVQTPSMKARLRERAKTIPIRVLPFMPHPEGYTRGHASPKTPNKDCRFIYISSGDPHKNHHTLLDAWKILADENIFPELQLTVTDKKLIDRIAALRSQQAMRIINHERLSHSEVLQLYRNADALIYPSLRESLGLPLIEARQAGLPIVAAEADYVRDLIDPEQSFDPHSPLSIARAVKRFMGIEAPALPLVDAKTFLTQVFE